MKIPEQEHSTTALIDKYHESKQEPPRNHLGCSMLGHQCDRWLWLSFRWAVIEKFPGRVLRLFRRGQMEEATITKDLRAIGVDVRDSQQRVDFGAFVSGSIDGIAESGVPEAPKKRHVVEYKTHSKKSFDALEKDGVEKSKPLHFVQMQTYLAGTKIDRALYVAVCKDDDRIYTERVRFNPEVSEWAIARGRRITMSERIPEPCSTDKTWFECRFCAAHDFCFESKITKEVNCRTCAHSTPNENSTFTCALYDNCDIPQYAQYEGCEGHVLHPDLVTWDMADSEHEGCAAYIIEGRKVHNGSPARGVFSSHELLANAKSCATADEFIESVRDEGGRIGSGVF